MNCTCGCCDGVRAVTPATIENRPGLGAIAARIGTHSSFLETMRARLSAADFPELAGLRTRDAADPAIALLDGCALLADVLTFYQERIANEGYLRTATERRSLVELARLIGYAPRPGVAASVFLAFGIEKDAPPTVIPRGSKANSVPRPGETMQAFETSADLPARFAWNAIRPRQVQPQTLATILRDGIFLSGTGTRLTPGDLLLLARAGTDTQSPAFVATVEPDAAAKRTRVTLRGYDEASDAGGEDALSSWLAALLTPAAQPPLSSAQLPRAVAHSFAQGADTLPTLLTRLAPALATSLYPALRNAAAPVEQPLEVYAMRIVARPFGHNAPLRLQQIGDRATPPEFAEWTFHPTDDITYGPTTIALDADHDVAPDTRLVIERADGKMIDVTKVDVIRHLSLARFGLGGPSVLLSWKDDGAPWLDKDDDFAMIRGSRVWLGSERLALADAPITDAVAGDTIDLDDVYEGLDTGRWLIVEGERSDVRDPRGRPVPGLRATELVMLAGVTQRVRGTAPPTDDGQGDGQGDGQSDGTGSPSMTATSGPKDPDGPQPGDTVHSTITIAASTATGAPGLAYRYKRDTVTIHANVAHATHGETRAETLGDGNAAQAMQRFALRQPPLTYVSARTPAGVANTLALRVNDVLWHEVATLATAGATDRSYTIATDDDGMVVATFGNGVRGMRVPSGRGNVKARYRSGIGAGGNVAARQISLLASRPLGVKDVVNPIHAAGGADREDGEAIRRNAPIAIMALDRLLSTSDYADFARGFAGIGKAVATLVGTRVNVVIAGVDDAPIDAGSDLYANLKDALRRFGDPLVPLTLTACRRSTLIVQAGVRIDRDYMWEAVEPQVRAALLAAFAFDRRDPGAPAFLSHAFRAIQSVRGVVSADIDVFDAVSFEQVSDLDGAALAGLLTQARARIDVAPDRIAYLSPAVPDTLILQELPS